MTLRDTPVAKSLVRLLRRSAAPSRGRSVHEQPDTAASGEDPLHLAAGPQVRYSGRMVRGDGTRRAVPAREDSPHVNSTLAVQWIRGQSIVEAGDGVVRRQGGVHHPRLLGV